MGNIVCGMITGLAAVVLYVYVSFTARCRGPILSNTYLFASAEERKKLDIKAEYHLVTVVFSILATVFAFMTVFIFTEWNWCLYVVAALIIFVLIYAIREGIKTEAMKKQ